MTNPDTNAVDLRLAQRRKILEPVYNRLQNALEAAREPELRLKHAHAAYAIEKMKILLAPFHPEEFEKSPLVALPLPETAFEAATLQRPLSDRRGSSKLSLAFLKDATSYFEWNMEVTRKTVLMRINLWKIYRTGRPGLVVLPEADILKTLEFSGFEKYIPDLWLHGQVPFIRQLTRGRRPEWGVLFPKNLPRRKPNRRYYWWVVKSENEALNLGFFLARMTMMDGLGDHLLADAKTTDNVDMVKRVFL